METVRIQCRSCGKELQGGSGKTYSCGCPNMTTIRGNSISARDMSEVIMLSSNTSYGKSEGLTEQDLMWQEERRKRKVRKLDFEVR
tara:strand:- start:1092 stop:1349 length:258 start_codon:yes stop_codon:yes gene_type:complete